MGYHRAGFEVVGVDIEPQPHYPFEFIRADALEILTGYVGHGFYLQNFTAIHASPPCQKFTRFQDSQPQRENKHPDLVGPTRELLVASGLPWVMENVPGSPLIDPVTVCGTAFGLEVERGQLWRHRWFEASFPIRGADCAHNGRPAVMVCGHGKDGYRGSGLSAAEAREAIADRLDEPRRTGRSDPAGLHGVDRPPATHRFAPGRLYGKRSLLRCSRPAWLSEHVRMHMPRESLKVSPNPGGGYPANEEGVLDLGERHFLLSFGPDGFLWWHDCPTTPAAWFWFGTLSGGQMSGHSISQREPLTIGGSLMCPWCGNHGFIESGRWRNA